MKWIGEQKPGTNGRFSYEQLKKMSLCNVLHSKTTAPCSRLTHSRRAQIGSSANEFTPKRNDTFQFEDGGLHGVNAVDCVRSHNCIVRYGLDSVGPLGGGN